VPGRSGVVVSLVAPGGERTMASDRAAGGNFTEDELDPAWLDGAAWLHVSGYTVATGSAVSEHAAAAARAACARVSVDLSSVSVIERFGVAAFGERLSRIAPDLVFATQAESDVDVHLHHSPKWVVKRGRDGIIVDGVAYPAQPADVIDTTGAGDALAAGFLVGGPELGIAAAARCVGTLGSMP
jgi:sugar/nucleoside kinase (ribokinase family)